MDHGGLDAALSIRQRQGLKPQFSPRYAVWFDEWLTDEGEWRTSLTSLIVDLHLTFGQKCPIVFTTDPDATERSEMNKRDRFIAEIREEARRRNLPFRIEYRRGKGGHAMIWIGAQFTTLPSREIDPKTARKIRKQLGLAD